MTNQEIKDLMVSATTKDDLIPLHAFLNQIKAKEVKVSKVLQLLEIRINNSESLDEIKDITI